MTSRNATSPMPLVDVGARSIHLSPSDRMAHWAIAAVQWPWLARGLHGGTSADKARLLARLDLPADALPALGGWKADCFLLGRLVDEVAATRPRVVVELGSGATTLVLARALAMHGAGRLISFDQHAAFSASVGAWLRDHGMQATLRHAPLVDRERDDTGDGWPGRWYRLDQLPDRIDMLVIDGPPWTEHALVRGAAERLFDRITPGGVVMLDDAARPGERLIARRWRSAWPQFDFAYDGGGAKGLLIARRRA